MTVFFFFKQKTAYEMRISDWSSDVCSSDLVLKVRQMDIRPIRNDDDHRAAVDEIRALWSAEAGSADEDRLDVLATLVDEYERKRWPVDKLDPVEAIEAAMEAEGRTQSGRASGRDRGGKCVEISGVAV